jgi:putative transposase
MTISITDDQSNIIAHMNYAAYKLWNVCNYEKRNYKALGLTDFPNWYYQKKKHKSNMWYKSLPSQTAQEVCKDLQEAWSSYFTLNKTGGVKNARPPRFKQDNIAITYMQNGLSRIDDATIRFTLPKALKKHMLDKYKIHADYLFLNSNEFKNMKRIKQIKIYPPKNNKIEIVVTYQIEDKEMLPDNGKYLSIDLGINNPFTCFDSDKEISFILGKQYKSICYYYNKNIAHYQSIAALQQTANGVKYPKLTPRVINLYEDRRNTLNDYFHKCTRWITDYCINNDIHTVVIGDITHIRDNKNLGDQNNQVFHAFPKAKIVAQLKYKLQMAGITLVEQKESYSSQCSPTSAAVEKKYAQKSNRKNRGLYVENKNIWNADAVGAYNILRLYFQSQNKCVSFKPTHLSNPVKVAV